MRAQSPRTEIASCDSSVLVIHWTGHGVFVISHRLRASLRAAQEALGLPRSTRYQSTRHTFASHWLTDGRPIESRPRDLARSRRRSPQLLPARVRKRIEGAGADPGSNHRDEAVGQRIRSEVSARHLKADAGCRSRELFVEIASVWIARNDQRPATGLGRRRGTTDEVGPRATRRQVEIGGRGVAGHAVLREHLLNHVERRRPRLATIGAATEVRSGIHEGPIMRLGVPWTDVTAPTGGQRRSEQQLASKNVTQASSLPFEQRTPTQ
jgi:hypothetical protein